MALAAAALGLGGVEGACNDGGTGNDPWWNPGFDSTLGYEGEGPGGRITIATINPTSWNAQAHNLVMTPAHLLLVQETRIAREDRLRGAKKPLPTYSTVSPVFGVSNLSCADDVCIHMYI